MILVTLRTFFVLESLNRIFASFSIKATVNIIYIVKLSTNEHWLKSQWR